MLLQTNILIRLQIAHAGASFYPDIPTIPDEASRPLNQTNRDRVRKFSAILLVCLFTFSQYARHLSYLECKILNTLQPVSKKCDCEKIAGFDKPGEVPFSAPKIHLHIHVDEFFTGPDEMAFSMFTAAVEKTGLLYTRGMQDGTFPAPWQPPNS